MSIEIWFIKKVESIEKLKYCDNRRVKKFLNKLRKKRIEKEVN